MRASSKQGLRTAKALRGDRTAAIWRLGLNMPPPPLPMTSPGGLQVRPVEALDRFVRHPGFGLTPQRVVSIYRSAEFGWCQDQVDLFEDIIENDGHLRSVIEARTLAVAGKDWQVLPGADDPLSVRASEILNEALTHTNFSDAIAFVVGARYYGYSATEIRWETVGADIVPTWFITIPHRRISFDAEDRPMLLQDFGTLIGEPLQPGRFIFATNMGPLTSRIARSGLLRTGTWFALWKRWSWRDWVVYAEKFGIPLILGKYDPNATEEQKDKLEETVTNIGEDGQAIMSNEAEVEIREAQATADSNLHKQIVAEANTEISKLITGSTLTVGIGGPGSFALGRVHETRAFDLVVADAKMMAQRFQADIATPFLKFNGFEGAAVPRLKIAIAREMDPIQRAEQFKIAQELGVPLDVEQVREEMQLRVPPSDDRILERQVDPAPSGGDAPPTDSE